MSDTLDQADETIDVFDQLVRERDELRAEVESVKDAYHVMKNVADQRHAEIERLRRRVYLPCAWNRCAEECQCLVDAGKPTTFEAEVKRLTDLELRMLVEYGQQAKAIERLRAAAQAVIDSINDENEIDGNAIVRLSTVLARGQ